MNKKLNFETILVTVLLSLSITSFADSKATFKDINGHWAQAIIEKYASSGIVKGMDADNFKPNQKITRAEFFALIHRGLDIQNRYFVKPDITKIYKDAKNEDWYANIAYDLYTNGIIDDKDYLRASDFITREEMAHYASKAYISKKGEQNVDTSVILQIKDFKSINTKYSDDVALAYQLNIVKGNPGGIFIPKGFSTRAEGLVVLNNLLDSLSINNEKPLEIVPSYTIDKEGLTMRITVRNRGLEDMKISHTSGQKYDFELLDENRKSIYKWSEGMMFTQMLQTTLVEKQGFVEFMQYVPYEQNEDVLKNAKFLVCYLKGTIEGQKIDDAGYTIEINRNPFSTVDITK